MPKSIASKAIHKQYRFVGISPRSRSGCTTCKSKKKKCDEVFPKCGLCQRIGAECIRPSGKPNDPSKQSKNITKIAKPNTQQLPPISQPTLTEPMASQPTIAEPTTDINDLPIVPDYQYPASKQNHPSSPHSLLLINPNPLDFNLDTINDLEDFLNSQEFGFPTDVSVQAMVSAYQNTQLTHIQPLCYIPDRLNVKGKEKQYLEYFIHSVATNISTVPSETNYWFNFYLPMAIHDECVLNGLISWGGVFLDNTDSRRYLNLSKDLLDVNLCRNTDRADLIKNLACAILLQAVEISSGDVKHWVTFSQIAAELINQLGGIHSLVGSKEEKYLASNFAFHDVLSSQAMINGPAFKIEEYEKIYTSDGVEYIDTLQSCVGPLFLIINDIVNQSRKLKSQLYSNYYSAALLMRNDSAVDYYASPSKSLQFNPNLSPGTRLELLKQLDSKYQYFLDKLDACQPSNSELEYFTSIGQLVPHTQVFQLYQYISQIVLIQAFQDTPPSSAAVQLLVHQASGLLEELLTSPVKGVLCLGFVVVGMNCIGEQERQEYMRRVQRWQDEGYIIGNVRRVMEMIRECWKNEGDGDFLGKLLGVVRKLDWDLTMV
ncbi:Uga3 protein [Saccharomycopsis crataegensis]|uniref:Uga3 protein n=1 Tax=Saccharomycopsis crataegensis TaxID=43959 RepID=A0AAV5QPS8_9ASCO|nr:Uga3 protein [Saccharomycopsis crataegensis]